MPGCTIHNLPAGWSIFLTWGRGVLLLIYSVAVVCSIVMCTYSWGIHGVFMGYSCLLGEVMQVCKRLKINLSASRELSRVLSRYRGDSQRDRGYIKQGFTRCKMMKESRTESILTREMTSQKRNRMLKERIKKGEKVDEGNHSETEEGDEQVNDSINTEDLLSA